MLTNKCSILKRIYAFLIDLCLIAITSLIFEYACCIPFFNSAFHLEEKSNQVIVEQVKTGLYFFVDNEYNVISSKENTEEEIISSYKIWTQRRFTGRKLCCVIKRQRKFLERNPLSFVYLLT